MRNHCSNEWFQQKASIRRRKQLTKSRPGCPQEARRICKISLGMANDYRNFIPFHATMCNLCRSYWGKIRNTKKRLTQWNKRQRLLTFCVRHQRKYSWSSWNPAPGTRTKWKKITLRPIVFDSKSLTRTLLHYEPRLWKGTQSSTSLRTFSTMFEVPKWWTTKPSHGWRQNLWAKPWLDAG